MANKPNIRFKGFTDDWEQRKLGEITNKGTKKNTELQYNETFTNSAEFGIISQSDFFDHSVSNPENICGYYIVENNSFVYNPRISNLAPVGPINRNKLGRIGIMSPLYTVFEVKNINVEYLEWFFKSSHWHSFMYFNGDTGARADRFSIKDTLFFEMPIPIPDIDEQAKIGEYFSTLDHLITLHQRKCDETKKLKKFMLQKMFPKNGEKNPEIRFAGFTDDWEQRKVTEIGEIYIGLVTTMTSHYTNQGALLIRNSDIKDSRFEFGDNPIYLDDEFAKQNASRKHRVGDVITVHTGDIGTSAVITDKEVGSIGFATIVTRPDMKKIISEYLCAYLNTDTHKNFALNISTGDGRNNYNLKDYYECVVPVPNIAEQRKISRFIDEMNHLITLHQRKCDKLKLIKKFMLQNMFPKKG